jgi:hypothetical protein
MEPPRKLWVGKRSIANVVERLAAERSCTEERLEQ